MGQPNNPFAPLTTDELTVVGHLRTLLTRLDPVITQKILTDLVGEKVPEVTGWEVEGTIQSGNDPDITLDQEDHHQQTYLLGLAKQPPVLTEAQLKETNGDGGGGRVDLYSTDLRIIIEAKTNGSLAKSQLNRYYKSIGADAYRTISWADVHRAIESHQEAMDPYPRGLAQDFLEFLTATELSIPQRIARREYASGGQKGVKKLIISDDPPLTVTFVHEWTKAEQAGDRDQSNPSIRQTSDCKRWPFTWEEFVALFEDIESRVSRDFIEDTFVAERDFDNRTSFSGKTVLGAIDPILDRIDDSDRELRFVYVPGNHALKLGHRETASGGPIGRPVNYELDGWMLTCGEGTDLLATHTERNPGFEKDLREALFLERDKETVRMNL